MNEQNNLQAISQGFVTKTSDAPEKASLVAAVVNTPAPTRVTQIGKPADFSNIDMSALVGNDDNVVEFMFTNNTGGARTLYISALFGQPGQHAGFGRVASAVDFATFLETSTDFQTNAGALKGFNARIASIPVVIKTITIQTDDQTQSNQKLTVGYLTKTLQPMENGIVPSLCDACYNNNDNAYTKEFKGPFGAGQSNFIGYKVLDGKSVTMRVEILGEAKVAQYTAG